MLVLKNVIQQLPKFNSLKEVRQTIKQYSPRAESLLEKHALMGMTIVAQKHAQLSPESRSAFHQAADMSKAYAKSIVQLVKDQPQSVKNNLDTTFPHASFVFNSPLFKQFLEHLERH